VVSCCYATLPAIVPREVPGNFFMTRIHHDSHACRLAALEESP